MAMLARQALHYATVWGDPHPHNAQVIVTTDAAYSRIVGQRGTNTQREYVVGIEGHFTCRPPRCATSGVLGGHGSPGATPVPLSYMTFNLPVAPADYHGGVGLDVRFHVLDLGQLGRVTDLQPYIDAIE